MLRFRATGADGPVLKFQWAPTLGGECYDTLTALEMLLLLGFNGHPPLGVNATVGCGKFSIVPRLFQWAPTLGGECYVGGANDLYKLAFSMFQWAPTLGGECYGIVYLITPPLCQGVDALLNISPRF